MSKKYAYSLKVQQKKRNQTSYMCENRDNEEGTLVEKDSFTTKLTAGDGVTEITIKEPGRNALPTGQAVKVTIECVQTTLEDHAVPDEPPVAQ